MLRDPMSDSVTLPSIFEDGTYRAKFLPCFFGRLHTLSNQVNYFQLIASSLTIREAKFLRTHYEA
jgi:hypothetical protein